MPPDGLDRNLRKPPDALGPATTRAILVLVIATRQCKQTCGLVNDHVASCFRYRELRATEARSAGR